MDVSHNLVDTNEQDRSDLSINGQRNTNNQPHVTPSAISRGINMSVHKKPRRTVSFSNLIPHQKYIPEEDEEDEEDHTDMSIGSAAPDENINQNHLEGEDVIMLASKAQTASRILNTGSCGGQTTAKRRFPRSSTTTKRTRNKNRARTHRTT